MNFEVIDVIGKRFVGREEEYLLKWKQSDKPTWEPKSNLSCHKLVLKFERSKGPEIIGARKENDTVTFLAKFDGKTAKVMNLSEAKKGVFNLIYYLESKIVWTDENQDDAPSLSNRKLVQSRQSDAVTVIYAKDGREGIMYFFEYENGEIAIVNSDEATVKQPLVVLDYLIKNID
ncbi:uncharacterized protein LOC129571757 [Sitodiplosis mosellana]|uniref:uncharacterized protein LOC129571757 n=1 Tax=Sitodiplosis mosellana TaxID=263140 RepID=UPI002444A643|nr:uncharacterized protein LOC129571757 [Sitodiplosis mosellana]